MNRTGELKSMCRFVTQTGLVLGVLVLAACAIGPPNRMEDYLGAGGGRQTATLPMQALRAGLVVIPDNAAPDAAPVLPEEAVPRLAERLAQEISRIMPVHIEKLIPAEGLRPVSGGDPEQFVRLGRQHGVDYLIVVVASATEQEYPYTVFVGWHSHSVPGLRRDNWSLLEAAIVEVETGQTLVVAEGRGWATLDRPTVPDISQWYPVIWLRPQDPNRPIWPPTYEGAPYTLRVVATNDASKQMVLHLRQAWTDKRAATSPPPEVHASR